jgi:hypothetical protein
VSVESRCCAVFFLTSRFQSRVQPQSADAPVRISGRFACDLRTNDGKDLKLNGCLPDEYVVDILDSDIMCELMEFGLVGGPQSYPSDALGKIPCW